MATRRCFTVVECDNAENETPTKKYPRFRFTNFLFWAKNAKAAALKAAQRKRVKSVVLYEGGDALKPPRLHVFSRE